MLARFVRPLLLDLKLLLDIELRGKKAIVDLAPDVGPNLVLVAVNVGVHVVDVKFGLKVVRGLVMVIARGDFSKDVGASLALVAFMVRRVPSAELLLQLLLDRSLIASQRVVDRAPDISRVLVGVAVLVVVPVVDRWASETASLDADDESQDGSGNKL